MSELQILFPDPETVELNGRDVELRAVQLRHFELYGKTASALVEVFSAASVQQINRYAEKHSAELKRVLRVTTSLNCWQLWRMPASVAVQLMAEVIRVNSGFFGAALPALARAINGAKSSSD